MQTAGAYGNVAPLPQPLQYGPPFPRLLTGSQSQVAPRWLGVLILFCGYIFAVVHFFSLLYFVAQEGQDLMRKHDREGLLLAYWAFTGVGALFIWFAICSPLIGWGLRYPLPAVLGSLRILGGTALHFVTATAPFFIIHFVLVSDIGYYQTIQTLAFFVTVIVFTIELVPFIIFIVLLLPYIARYLRIQRRKRAGGPRALLPFPPPPPVDLLYSPRGPGLGSPLEQYPIIPAAMPIESADVDDGTHPHLKQGRWHCRHDSPKAASVIVAVTTPPTAARARGSPARYAAAGYSPAKRLGAHPYYTTDAGGVQVPTYKP